MVTPVSYYAPAEMTSPKWAHAFARGCGGSMTDETELFPGPVALFGSPARWPVLRAAQAEGRDWYYGDHGYLGRKTYYRITRNAYQHDGRGETDGARFKGFKRPVQPWRTAGRHIVVCPNSAVYFNLHGLDVEDWLRETLATLRRHTDREIRVRWKIQTYTHPIKLDLEDAWATVVFSSACALDSLIAGVPIFVTAPFAAGALMGLSDLSRIESPVYPDDRERFLGVLADNQWTMKEMMKGHAWRWLTREESAHAA